MGKRTFAIGDIHGDRVALTRLMSRLPRLTADDTVVFIGDYVDRGPDPLGVIRDVQAFCGSSVAKVVTLRGNHEDKWIISRDKPDLAFLVQVNNGCHTTYRSIRGVPPLGPNESLPTAELREMLEVKNWMPLDLHEWMSALPLWYEDEHAIYVHAGLDGEGTEWKHPSASRPAPLMWMRDPGFFTGYRGKRLVFGHTPTTELPVDHLGPVAKWFDDPGDIWIRGDLIGIDTGAGKGGFLSAIELPKGKVYESR